jgi:2-polyprenyl-6-methoxyphenol hydroxylase-like FAD-dependent oxidoreductase
VSTQDDSRWEIAIAGGSLGGLCAGVALYRAGYDVQVYERDAGPMTTRGAGIVVQGEVLELLRKAGAAALPTTSCAIRRYLDPDGGGGRVQSAPQAFTSWEAIYVTLKTAFPADRYHMGAALSDVTTQAGGRVNVSVQGRGRLEVDLLVCADGAQSSSRRRLLPEIDSLYAGYVAWRGVVDEADAPAALSRFFDGAFTFSEARSGGHILAYFIPGQGANSAPGRRRLNWVWYVPVAEGALMTLLLDREGVQHRASLPPGLVPRSSVNALVERARREVHPRLAELVSVTQEPFVQAIIDVAVPRTVFGRLCLLGDAAFVVRPHTAGSTAKAAFDATNLAKALERSPAALDVGLSRFEKTQLKYGNELSEYGMELGRRFAAL